MFKHLLTTLPLVSLLAACSDPVEDARQAVTAALGPKGTTEVSDAVHYRSGAVCGRYERFDRWGESSSRRSFIYLDGETMIRPSQDDLTVYCTDNPKLVVQEKLGIPLTGDGAEQTATVAGDLSTLAEALERYLQDNGSYPSTEQGLQALISEPESFRPLKNYPAGGYLDALPKDPWQQPYQYEGPAWGGVKTPYSLWTFGADNAPGGSGAATDISAKHLQYLAFAAGL
ncbi:type II secretion system protein GspG [Parahaliea mediterranea]|uniref:type II secretion system protein GspG n=1 Tax=Parahaliea mediterranea TaxID=651086 RepID=UPI000E2F0F7D|nr:type II secretion system protein GspG [Parahaliea mediterranea]